MTNILSKLKHEKVDLNLLLKYIDKDTIKGKSSFNELLEVLFDKIDYYGKILETIIDPPSGTMQLYEVNELTDEDKRAAWDLVIEVMQIKRRKERLTIVNDEKTELEVLNRTLKEWDSIVPKITNILEHMERVWSNKKGDNVKLNYLG